MALSREIRKVLRGGRGSSLMITLPKEYCKMVDLGPGDRVYILVNPDLTLTVVPEKLGRTRVLEFETYYRDLQSTLMEIVACYLTGVDRVTVHIESVPENERRELKERVRELLLGAEVFLESSNSITFSFADEFTPSSVALTIQRMFRLAEGMTRDIAEALRRLSTIIMEDVGERDTEVNRLCFLVLRQLVKAVRSPSKMSNLGVTDLREVIMYSQMVRVLERICDHCKIFVTHITKLGLEKVKPLSEDLAQGFTYARQLLEQLRSCHARISTAEELPSLENVRTDLMKCLETVDKYRDLEYHLSKRAREVLSGDLPEALAFSLANLHRIVDYCLDICELLIDLLTLRELKLRYEYRK